MRRVPWLVLVACGHPPAAHAPPADQPVAAAADLAGKWVTSDDLDWGYSLTIDADGGYDQWIDRGHMGRCEQKGALTLVAPRTFRIAFAREECHRDASLPNGLGRLTMKVGSFTGDVLVLELAGDGLAERHVYRRAP